MKPSSRSKRGTRVQVHYQAVLTASDGHESNVVVTDISSRGFRVEGADGVQVGERVHLAVAKHSEVAAEIRWALGDEAGGVFLEAFDPPAE